MVYTPKAEISAGTVFAIFFIIVLLIVIAIVIFSAYKKKKKAECQMKFNDFMQAEIRECNTYVPLVYGKQLNSSTAVRNAKSERYIGIVRQERFGDNNVTMMNYFRQCFAAIANYNKRLGEISSHPDYEVMHKYLSLLPKNNNVLYVRLFWIGVHKNYSEKYGFTIEQIEAYINQKPSKTQKLAERSLMTKDLREEILVRDHYTCQSCGFYPGMNVAARRALQVDHIVPVAKGGLTVENNLQVLCANCNVAKRDGIS
jgi:Restriction endonuclease